MPEYVPSSTEAVIQLTDLQVIVVDYSAKTWTLKAYDTSTSSWVTMLTVDFDGNVVGVGSFTLPSATVQNDLTVDGNASVGGTLSVTGASTLSGGVSGNLAVSGAIKSTNVNLKKSASPTVATSTGTPAETTIITPDADHNQIVLLGGTITIGGTLATGEDITVTIVAYYSDSTTGSISKTFSALGTTDLTTADIHALIKDGTYITKITAKAQSNKTTTSATATVEISAFQG